jgi:hypothetical protein
MPSTPYAKLLASINAGPPQDGAITTAAAGDTVQLSAESTAQWDLSTPPRWEIYSYPPGWSGPASGWTTESVALPTGGTADVYTYLGLGPPPAFDLPAAPEWGKTLYRLTVQGGLLNGVPSTTLVDDTLAIEVVSSNGLHDTAALEGIQFSSDRAWAGAVQENWRIIDTALSAGSIGPYGSTPATVASGTGSAGVSTLYARGDHSHQLTFATLNTILAAASAPILVNGQTLTSGGMVAPYFASTATPVATSGLLRGVHNSVIVASRDSANSDNVPIVSYGTSTTDHVTIGDSVIPCMEFVIASGCDFNFYGDTQLLYMLAQGSFAIGPTNPFNIVHTTGTGAGTTATIRAQNGAATFNGGTLLLQAGVPGAGGGLATGVTIDVQNNATTSGTLSIQGGSFGEFLGSFYDDSLGETYIGMPAHARVSADSFRVDVDNIALFSPTDDFGGGTGVIFVDDADAEPTGDVPVGLQVWVNKSALKTKNYSLAVLAPEVETAPGNEDLRAHDIREARVTTTDATPTIALEFEMPDPSIAKVKMEVTAITLDGGESAAYERTGVFKRFVSNVTPVGSITTQIEAEDNAALDATLTNFSTLIRVQVTGLTAKTFEWFVRMEVMLMDPS